MQVHLTFDIEVWCRGWDRLDADFPRAFSRYVYGRSRHGDFALPATLDLLAKHNLQGVFFVEPLFAARFGVEYLAEIVRLIQDAGQDVQLHLHPEWVDEITPPLLPEVTKKRQHLRYYSREEQTTLIRHGLRLLREAGAETVTAFRAGGFAANRNTFLALAENGINVDSSLNATMSDSAPDMRGDGTDFLNPSVIEGVHSYPVTVFRDGFGHYRHAQVGACAFREMRQAIEGAEVRGVEHFVLFSHNFEMLRPGTTTPDRLVVRRFRNLCDYLASAAQRLPTGCLPLNGDAPALRGPSDLAAAGPLATARRYAEQAARRLMR